MPPSTPMRRKLLAPPNYSPKPWIPPRPKVSKSTPTKLLRRILAADGVARGNEVESWEWSRCGGRYEVFDSRKIHFWYKQACEIHTDQRERDQHVLNLKKKAEFCELKKAEAMIQAQLDREHKQQVRRLLQGEAQRRERQRLERRAALVAAANAKEKLRTQLFDRRRAIKRLRSEPPVRQPVWLCRDTLARPMYMPRM